MADRVPDCEQDALAFVVTGTVLMRLTEITESDGAVDRSNDHPDRDLGWIASHDIAAADTALGPNQASALERKQDLLEVGLGQTGALCNIAHRSRPTVVVEDQGQQRAARVVSPRRHRHGGSVVPGPAQPSRVGAMESDAIEHTGDSGALELGRTLPTYDDRCVTAVAPALLAGVEADLVSDAVAAARTVVLLVVDGLGWHQLRRHRSFAPSLAAASDATPPITTVAPSTTAAALTSLATGAAPGEHGLVGYRIATPLGLLNALRWRAGGRDVRAELPPEELQPVEPFCGQPAAVVTRAQFRHSGFSGAHLRGGTFWGCHDLPGFIAAVRGAVDEGFGFVFAYHDTVDKIAHEFGLGERYRSALAETERLAAALRDVLPDDTPLMVTADHGVVEVLEPPVMVDPEVVALTEGWSGEARLLWLHACTGAESELAAACERYAGIAEIAPVEQVLDEQWLGRHVTVTARGRLGDVALVPRGLQAFTMPDEDQPQHALIGRHGGLTAEEMLVPFAPL